MNDNIFEYATKHKVRFDTSKGQLTVEDLWDLSLNSLDTLAKSVNKQLQAESEESFLPTKRSNGNKLLTVKLDLLKHVIAVKVDEDDKRKARVEKQAQLARLRELAANKADAALSEKSLEDIQAMIASLEAE